MVEIKILAKILDFDNKFYLAINILYICIKREMKKWRDFIKDFYGICTHVDIFIRIFNRINFLTNIYKEETFFPIIDVIILNRIITYCNKKI